VVFFLYVEMEKGMTCKKGEKSRRSVGRGGGKKSTTERRTCKGKMTNDVW